MTAKAKVLQSWVPEQHARQFREIVARKGLTVSAALYRYVLQVLREDRRKKGLGIR